jgi:hypothetical protein
VSHIKDEHYTFFCLPVIDAIVAYWKASETTWKFRAPPAYAGILSENGKPVCQFADQPLGASVFCFLAT